MNARYDPEPGNALSGEIPYDEVKPFFNFGLADIDEDGNLTLSTINTDQEVYTCLLVQTAMTQRYCADYVACGAV